MLAAHALPQVHEPQLSSPPMPSCVHDWIQSKGQVLRGAFSTVLSGWLSGGLESDLAPKSLC